MTNKKEHFLSKFLQPESVAIIGASNNRLSINYHLSANLINLGYPGKIYPVNPNEKEILGLRTYASVLEIDASVDLAVIGVAHAATVEVLKECAAKGIKRVTLIAGGFSETGTRGKKIQKQMLRILRDNGMRAIGPNALSPINVPANFCISFHPLKHIKQGSLSLIFQSGLYEPRFQWLLSDFNYHFNKLIDLGNKMDINEVDALSYLVQDPQTRVIGIHMESIAGDGRDFIKLLRQASAQGKRVVVLKSGRTKAGAKAAASHTGALVRGSDRVFDGAMRQCGALRVHNLEEFFDLTRALECFGSLALKRNRIFIGTFPGGEAVIVTDLLERVGLRLANVNHQTYAKLKPIFPPWDIPLNPWDLGLTIQFHHPAKIYRTVVESVIEDPAIDGLALQLHPMMLLLPKDQLLDALVQAAEARKPVALWIAGMEPGRHENLQWLEEKGVAVFASPEKAISALSALYRFSGRKQANSSSARHLH